MLTLPRFEWVAPSTVDEVLTSLSTTPGETLLVAGGTDAVPNLKHRLHEPRVVVHLGRVAGLRFVRDEADGLHLGPLVTLSAVAADPLVRRHHPSLARAASLVAGPQLRNMGTLGGALANNDPAADWPAAVLGSGATVRTNQRAIAAADFFKGMFETALAADEIVTAVEFPLGQRTAYAKFPNPASRFALVGVFVARAANGDVRVAVTGAAPAVFRATALEDALRRSFTPSAAKGASVDAGGLMSDLHGSAEYRAHLISVMASRAVAAMA